MTEDEVERRFRRIIEGLDVGTVAIAWPRDDAPPSEPASPPDRAEAERQLQHRLGSLRLAVGLCALVMLAAGRWVAENHTVVGGWAGHHVVTFWGVWALVVIPTVALLVTSVVGRVQARRRVG